MYLIYKTQVNPVVVEGKTADEIREKFANMGEAWCDELIRQAADVLVKPKLKKKAKAEEPKEEDKGEEV